MTDGLLVKPARVIVYDSLSREDVPSSSADDVRALVSSSAAGRAVELTEGMFDDAMLMRMYAAARSLCAEIVIRTRRSNVVLVYSVYDRSMIRPDEVIDMREAESAVPALHKIAGTQSADLAGFGDAPFDAVDELVWLHNSIQAFRLSMPCAQDIVLHPGSSQALLLLAQESIFGGCDRLWLQRPDGSTLSIV